MWSRTKHFLLKRNSFTIAINLDSQSALRHQPAMARRPTLSNGNCAPKRRMDAPVVTPTPRLIHVDTLRREQKKPESGVANTALFTGITGQDGAIWRSSYWRSSMWCTVSNAARHRLIRSGITYTRTRSRRTTGSKCITATRRIPPIGFESFRKCSPTKSTTWRR
jgi:hypothetical protein